MNPTQRKRAIILLALTEVTSRAIAKTGGEATSAVVNGQDIETESDNMAVMAMNKQLKLRGKA